MKNQRAFALAIFAALIFACLQTAVLGQTANDKLANVTAGGSSVRWDVAVSNSGGTLTISAPDGRVFQKEFKAGASPEFTITDKQADRLPDGTYTYELRLAPALSPGIQETLKAGRGKDDDPEAERAARKRAALPALVQSGSFSILNGSVIVEGAVENSRRTAKTTDQPQLPTTASTVVTKVRLHHPPLNPMPDQVIPDDLIVQGSACIGLDCVNNETFGFDTIRLKENNTRISFNDTSTAAGFPTNDWTIRANSSSSGGASFLAFVDRGTSESGEESGTIVFEVDAGAPANALKVSNVGKVGVRTATPVLDFHITSTDTPAHRLEQTSGGGFTAQTWDIGANEAICFVRDVTGGSRLPFRVRPGAPTSSIDINASGNVGIGTASPATRLHSSISSSNTVINSIGAADIGLFIANSDTTANNLSVLSLGNSFPAGQAQIGVVNIGTAATSGGHLFFNTRVVGGGLSERMRIDSSGNVGIGTPAPTALLSVNGTANKPGGGSWDVFSDERLKNIKGRFNSGLKAVMQLQPIRYEYKRDNALGLKSEGEHVGFGAQALQKIIPEAVTRNSEGYLMVNNDPILWTMLNAIKEQQKEIGQLKEQVRQLRAASHRRTK